MKEYDVVYILKNGIDSDEIRYSLRSIEQNFPHRKVWIYGGKPEGIEPDRYVEVIQKGRTRYSKVTNTIKQICQNEEITDRFWLFNDDFFVTKKVEDMLPVADGSIAQRVRVIEAKTGIKSSYALALEHTAEILARKGYDTLCYAVHLPMLIDRKAALEALAEFPGEPMFRCIYGNYVAEASLITADVKVFGDEAPEDDWLFLSTDDTAWSSKAGEYIRAMFRRPSRWER